MDKVEVVVVGAGLSGLAAALVLAEEGAEVLVVERGEYPGSKNVSGGRLYTKPVRELLPAGLLDDAPFERRVVKERLTVACQDSSFTAELTSDYLRTADHGVTILRAPFDQWLAEQTSARGALIAPGYTVDSLIVEDDRVAGIRAAGADIRADVVVLAEGILGFLAQDAGLRPALGPEQFAVAVKEVIELPPESIQERFGCGPEEGVAQLFLGAVTDGMMGGGFLYTNRSSISLGLVVSSHALADWRTAEQVAADGEGSRGEEGGPSSGASEAVDSVPLNELVERFKSRPEVAPLIAGGDSVEYSAHGVLEGGMQTVGRLHRDGLVVVGDAAGLGQNLGITVRGMDFALASGALAGRAVASARQKGDYSSRSLSKYDELLAASFVIRDLETFRHMPKMLSSPRLFNEYPELVCELVREAFFFGDEPKKRLVSSSIAKARAKLRLADLARDAWRAIRI